MSPDQKRNVRIQDLQRLFLRVYRETGSPQKAHEATLNHAYQIASRPIARDYVDEVIRRVQK